MLPYGGVASKQMSSSSKPFAPGLLSSFWTIAVLLTAIRLGALMASPSTLGPDESQYWFWSQELAFGYFSKPPMIAWVIAATTSIFGNAEWAVRLSAPFFHLGVGAFLYLTAQRLFNQRAAYWSGLAWLTIPGVTLSSFLMTTDAPLLFFWSAGLFFLFRITEKDNPQRFDFVALGAAIGLGFLSKYAMIYFIIALGGTVLFIPSFRLALLRKEMLLTAVIALALILPNILWNAANDFQTLSHTAANANWGATLFKPAALLKFIAGQFAVIGPVFVVAFIWAAIHHRRNLHTLNPQLSKIHALFLFAITPLLIVSIQAFISRAHANWAATAYPAVILLVIAWLYEHKSGWIAKTGIAINAVFAALFIIIVSTEFSVVDRSGLSIMTRDIRGWKEQSHAVASMADGYDAVMIDDRDMMGAMLYYERGSNLKIVAIDPNASISHHYEAFMAFDPKIQSRMLFVTTRDDAAHVDYRFRHITPLGPVTVSLGSGQKRTYHLFDVSGYFGPDAPERDNNPS